MTVASNPASTDPATLREKLAKDGFIIVDDVLPPDLFEKAKVACEAVIDRAREGNWPHRRIVGKSFPPWPAAGPDIWGVQHIMHPSLSQPVFAEIYTSPTILSTSQSLLNVSSPKELQLELFNLLINPHTTAFSLPWHRDSIPHKTPAEEEEKLLNVKSNGTQWNLALYDDACLLVVPGSHKVVKSPELRETLLKDDMAETLPGENILRVELKPNQAVFYENNILHRAEYTPGKKRVTLHGCVGKVEGGEERATMVLQHGLEWMLGEEFKGTLTDEGKVMQENLVKLKEKVGGDVGYSHKDSP